MLVGGDPPGGRMAIAPLEEIDLQIQFALNPRWTKRPAARRRGAEGAGLVAEGEVPGMARGGRWGLHLLIISDDGEGRVHQT